MQSMRAHAKLHSRVGSYRTAGKAPHVLASATLFLLPFLVSGVPAGMASLGIDPVAAVAVCVAVASAGAVSCLSGRSKSSGAWLAWSMLAVVASLAGTFMSSVIASGSESPLAALLYASLGLFSTAAGVPAASSAGETFYRLGSRGRRPISVPVHEAVNDEAEDELAAWLRDQSKRGRSLVLDFKQAKR